MAVVRGDRRRSSESTIGIDLQSNGVSRAIDKTCLVGGKKRKRDDSQSNSSWQEQEFVQGQFDDAMEPYDTSLESAYLSQCRSKYKNTVPPLLAEEESRLTEDTRFKPFPSNEDTVEGQFEEALQSRSQQHKDNLVMQYFFLRTLEAAKRFQRQRGVPVEQNPRASVAGMTLPVSIVQPPLPHQTTQSQAKRQLQPILPKPVTGESTLKEVAISNDGEQPKHANASSDAPGCQVDPSRRASPSSNKQKPPAIAPSRVSSHQNVPIAPQPLFGFVFVFPTMAPSNNARATASKTSVARTAIPKSKARRITNQEVARADVLFGRGGTTAKFPGNVAFQALVRAHRNEYKSAPKGTRTAVARKVVAAIHDNQGRFLKRDDKDKKFWYEVDDDEAIQKTGSALREGRTNKQAKGA